MTLRLLNDKRLEAKEKIEELNVLEIEVAQLEEMRANNK